MTKTALVIGGLKKQKQKSIVLMFLTLVNEIQSESI